MNKLLITAFAATMSFAAHAQSALDKKVQEVLVEGKMLYRMESVNRQAPALFQQKYKGKEKPAGSFSYVDKDEVRCIFYGSDADHSVLGSVIVDTSLDFKGAITDVAARKLSKREHDLFEMYTVTLAAIKTDTFFKSGSNVTIDVLPIIADGEKKAYVMSFPQKSGTVMLGNDYLITFSNDITVSIKKKLHKQLLTVTNEEKNIGNSGYTMHTHVQEGDGLIYATDLCTLMLYKNTGKWRQHYVISRNHVCIWDKDKGELSVLTLEEWQDQLKNPDKAAKAQAQH